MATTELEARNAAPVPEDDLDDLFDYDVRNVFQDVDVNMDVPARETHTIRGGLSEHGAGLGIDEEVKVRKKRAPIPKLDENRLLSSAGIPKLRRIAKERLRFKGKGYEYSDVARLLNVYQLWLDDLYPRAKFADGLAIIEKLGHTKRLQTMRKEWMNEGKPHGTVEESTTGRQILKDQQLNSTEQAQLPPTKPVEGSLAPAATNAVGADLKELYRSTTKETRESPESHRNRDPEKGLFLSDDEEVDGQLPDDDLEALLAEDEMKGAAETRLNAIPEQPNSRGEENFDDEMEAMVGMDDIW